MQRTKQAAGIALVIVVVGLALFGSVVSAVTPGYSLSAHPSVGRWQLDTDITGLGSFTMQAEILPDGTAKTLEASGVAGVWQPTGAASAHLIMVGPELGPDGDIVASMTVTAAVTITEGGSMTGTYSVIRAPGLGNGDLSSSRPIAQADLNGVRVMAPALDHASGLQLSCDVAIRSC